MFYSAKVRMWLQTTVTDTETGNMSVVLTVHNELKKCLLVSVDGAAVTAVYVLIFDLHSSQQQGGVSFGQLILEQGCSVLKVLVLETKLVHIIIV